MAFPSGGFVMWASEAFMRSYASGGSGPSVPATTASEKLADGIGDVDRSQGLQSPGAVAEGLLCLEVEALERGVALDDVGGAVGEDGGAEVKSR
jgi:hypothetical protein